MKNKGKNILNLLSKKERVKIDASNGHDQRKLEKEHKERKELERLKRKYEGR